MILYTQEARESWRDEIKKAKEKIMALPGDYLSYNESGDIMQLLNMLCEYINMEERGAK